ncbi:MAG: DUF1707 domain-containing protein [Solirubrobacteraceae bacterium]
MDQRASDTDREQAADTLRAAAADGRLTVDELDDRLGSAYAAATRTELERVTGDLLPAAPSEAPMPVRPGEDGERRIVSIMGAADRTGRWKLARECRVLNVMGGADLDLNEAELAADRVELRITSIMGGSTVYLPENLNVEVSETAIMGGNQVKLGNHTPNPGGPVLRIRLFSVMGGTDLKRGPKRTLRERLHRGH